MIRHHTHDRCFIYFFVKLNLKKCENTYIGDPERGFKGISNGEKRRLAVATEVNADFIHTILLIY